MIQSNQGTSFGIWKTNIQHNELSYGNSVWEDLGKHPQDDLFFKLGEMYLSADPKQRNEISEFFDDNHQYVWQLVLFTRRLAKMINSKDQINYFQIGLSIADITASHDDPRDILISLAILKKGAERAGIDATKLIEDAVPNISTNLSMLLQNMNKWSESSMNLAIREFGPKDWYEEQ